LITLVFSSTAYAAPRTTTVWKATSKEGVGITPYVRADKKALFIDFESFLKNTEYIYYNLNYTNKDNGVKGGVEGSFIPNLETYTGYLNGKPYIRKEILFGSCSRKVCKLHKVKDVTLTVNTKMKLGKDAQYTTVLHLPDDQF
jgi:hypothetical protein